MLSKGHTLRFIAPCTVLLALFSLSSGCADGLGPQSEPASANSSAPETDDQKILNALGQALAQNVVEADLTAEELAFLQRGLADAVLGQEALVDLDEFGPQIQGFMQQRAAVVAEAELVQATAFLEEQANADGAERTESGIVILEITAGSGDSPAAEDTVQVHYHGTLRDGTVFDSSVDRGEPATFPLSGVIPCWTEGLQHIAVGGKSRLVCPPDLAYGPQGPPGIPGNAALVFEVELLDIVED